ncbi:hypothetical protein ACX12L_18750 [Alicycliphilus sp. T452]|jgi:TPR repeat protein
MNPAPPQHPCTLLGAARMALAPVDDTRGMRLKAHAACRLGYHRDARRLWESMARAGDADALYQLGQMAEQGLGEPPDGRRARALYQRAAQAGHAAAAARLA